MDEREEQWKKIVDSHRMSHTLVTAPWDLISKMETRFFHQHQRHYDRRGLAGGERGRREVGEYFLFLKVGPTSSKNILPPVLNIGPR